MSEKQYQVVNGTSYDVRTPKNVVEILENARMKGQKIRFFYGDSSTGQDWCDEYETFGYIGRSCGTNKVPLLINRKNSSGGVAILDHCIVRITIDKKNVYQNPNYHSPLFEIKGIDDVELKKKGYTTSVFSNGKVYANCKSEESARRLVSFLKGERNAK